MAVYSGVEANQEAQAAVGVGQSGRKTLSMWGQVIPTWQELNSMYSGGWNAAGAKSTRQLLMGSAADSGQTVGPYFMRHAAGAKAAWQDPVTGQISYTKQAGWKKVSTMDWSTPASEGLLDVAGDATKRFTQMGIESANMGRDADIAALQKYAPMYAQQAEQMNPELMALRRQLGLDASQQLALGDRMNPDQMSRVRNDTYGRFANQGFNPGSGQFVDANALLNYTGAGQALRQQRQGYALNATQELASTAPDYLRFILGQQGAMPAAMSFIQNQQPLTYAKNYDPMNSQSSQIQQQAAATKAAGYSSLADTLGGISGGLFSLAGNMGGGSKPNYNTPDWMSAAGGYRVQSKG
jgi:hypothetical protein